MYNIQSIYEEVWWELQKMGYDTGDDISYFDFTEACENVGPDPEDIDIDTFSEIYNVNIG